jgi:uncharacterized OB-fold protein
MFDENNYPTLRYMKCKQCGNVFVMSFAQSSECPECASENAEVYLPGTDDKRGETGTPGTPQP